MEIIAVIFSLLSVILTVTGNKHCWTLGIIGIIGYMTVFAKLSMWGNFSLQFIFIGQSLLGLYNWNKKTNNSVEWIDMNKTIVVGSVLMIGIIISSFYKLSPMYFDISTTIISILAMFLISYRKTDGWVYWILADVMFVIMFYKSELYLSSCTYFIFLVLSVIGLIKWNKIKKVI